jgi:protein-S-isoprenylcysteine O-methyltransferase Ste14
MDRFKFVDRLLDLKPSRLMSAGLLLIIAAGILGEFLAWERFPWRPFSNLFGGAVLIGGWLFHLRCHQFHRQAHERSAEIRGIVATGPFAWIRHPMYLSLILMNGGLVLAWGIRWMLAPLLLFIGLVILILIQEEKFLLQTAGPEYREYMEKVPWRLVPKVF